MQPVEIGGHFPAKWQGYCAWCGEAFMPRDELTFVEDEIVCLACVEEALIHNEWLRLDDILGDTRVALPDRTPLALPRADV